ncbi:hypothetical protein OAN24_00035 [Pseudodesulfovibrio sp.]|nr:hypothetical protein [Pseudodesulfovibrio sp.]
MLLHRVKTLIVISFLLMSVTISPALATEVVVLHSTPKATNWTDQLALGFSAQLGDAAQISQVYLGSPTDDDDYYDARFNELAAVWGEHSPAAVITDGELAFAFMRKYREDLFVEAPVIYCGMVRPEPEQLRQCGDCTGVPLRHGLEETIHLIFALRPETTTLVGIMDGSQESIGVRVGAEMMMESSMDRAQILFPGHEKGDNEGLSVELVKTVASSVPRSGAVLFLGFAADNAGNPVDTAEIIRLIARRSVAPVFVLSDEFLPTDTPSGVLGGVVVQGQAQGREVARLFQRIQSGEPVREMLTESIPPQPVVDLTVLARFGLAEKALPAGTTPINTPMKPAGTEGLSSTGVVWIVAGLSVLLVLFLIFRRRKHVN